MSLCSPPLIETYSEGAVCPSYACLYSSVLSLLQKPANVRLMSRTVNTLTHENCDFVNHFVPFVSVTYNNNNYYYYNVVIM